MNARTLILILAVGLVFIGLVMTVAGLFDEPTPEQTVRVARAAREIPPYTIVTSDMIRLGDPIRARDARDEGAYPFQAVEGDQLMTTQRLAAGDLIVARNALPPEQVRFTEDFNLEIVSFSASADQMVGGKIRPGHIINLYGTGRDEDNNDFTTLIEKRLWVVGVSSGAQSVSAQTLQPDLTTGELQVEGDTRERPATLLTLAVEPRQAFAIIDALGARGLEPYVTLAASQDPVAGGFATPVIAPTEAGLPPDLALTATALFLQIQATPPPPPPPTGGGGLSR